MYTQLAEVLSQSQICAAPIFIIGAPRSGTSALAWSLAQHGQLWTSGEFHLLFGLFGTDQFEQQYRRESVLPEGLFQHQSIDKPEFLRYMGLGLNALLTNRSRGKRWIQQTPIHTMMVEVLAEMFPGARFLHLLRDGRDVVSSMINFHNAFDADVREAAITGGWDPPWSRDFRLACRTWAHSVEKAVAFCAASPQRALTVNYAELTSQPDALFSRIFSFLGIADEPGPASFFRDRRINSSFRGDGAAPKPRLNPWTRWTREQRMIFIGEAGHTLLECGFATEDDLYLSNSYKLLRERIRRVVRATLPDDSVVAVVSKGDDELLDLGGPKASHFPSTEEGGYLGFHPANGAEAVECLKNSVARGAEYLLIPQTSFWWIDYYRELCEYLGAHHRWLPTTEACVICDLRNGRSGP